ncbi:hypothetical protein ACOJCM_14715 [Billgrantia sp. LNSP4103-1]|uniref:hypothetical protein n=1 Tax=Billgrantia sp. LNSP4103-1 TaxID=3410266 RepID=UPI00403F607B
MSSAQNGRFRGPNVKPTKAAIANYFRLLQDKANQGDTLAAAELIKIDLLDRRKETAV